MGSLALWFLVGLVNKTPSRRSEGSERMSYKYWFFSALSLWGHLRLTLFLNWRPLVPLKVAHYMTIIGLWQPFLHLTPFELLLAPGNCTMSCGFPTYCSHLVNSSFMKPSSNYPNVRLPCFFPAYWFIHHVSQFSVWNIQTPDTHGIPRKHC